MEPEYPIDVSVVVPIRNGAPFLEDCIGFLKAQTYPNYELILVVDDRSYDETVEMSKHLLEDFDKSTLIVQDKGLKLSGNRNIGLDAAHGDAVWFVDVDDAPAPDFIKDMYGLLKETDSDFVCCNFVNVGVKGVVKEKRNAVYHHKVMNREEAFISRRLDEFPVSAWSKLFKRSFLIDNDLYFQESYAEDIVYTYRCIEKCTRMCIYNRPLYAYRQTPDSICRAKGNLDLRGTDEIKSYEAADLICADDPEALKRNAIMKIRSSGHMSYHAFMEFAKSQKNRESYEKYLKGTFEGWWHLHLSSLYWLAIRFYVAAVYKRNGSMAMTKKWW